jgi:putative aldouronate transport system substrate-binding protein
MRSTSSTATVLAWGLVDPNDPQKGVDAYIAAQKKAGVDKIMAEIQTQLDTFIQANSEIFK